jgi:hypothetical protein
MWNWLGSIPELSRLEGELWRCRTSALGAPVEAFAATGQAVREHLADLGFKQSRVQASPLRLMNLTLSNNSRGRLFRAWIRWNSYLRPMQVSPAGRFGRLRRLVSWPG